MLAFVSICIDVGVFRCIHQCLLCRDYCILCLLQFPICWPHTPPAPESGSHHPLKYTLQLVGYQYSLKSSLPLTSPSPSPLPPLPPPPPPPCLAFSCSPLPETMKAYDLKPVCPKPQTAPYKHCAALLWTVGLGVSLLSFQPCQPRLWRPVPEWKKKHYCITRALCSRMEKNITVSPEPSVPEWKKIKIITVSPEPSVPEWKKIKIITVSPEPSVPEWKKTPHYCITIPEWKKTKIKLLYSQSPLFQNGKNHQKKHTTVSPEPSAPEWKEKNHYCISRALCSRMEKTHITVSPEPSVPEWKKTHYCITRALLFHNINRNVIIVSSDPYIS